MSVWLFVNAWNPIATFSLPLIIDFNAWYPVATFLLPDELEANAWYPNTLLVEISPTPLPTVSVLTLISLDEIKVPLSEISSVIINV